MGFVRRASVRSSQLAAIITLAVLPPILVFLFFQRHIVSGIAAGAVKG